jgi:lactate dehydrogenase-like 2-hydroxyacid dehydrogenase
MYGTGVGGIDTTHAAAKGIAVCNVPGYSTEAVAEFAIACILAQLRELHRARQQVSQRQYSEEAFHGRELQFMLLGILGLGNIGRRVAELARIGFGARVNYWSRHRKLPSEQQGIVYRDLDTLLRESDIVSIHLAHNRSTDRFLHSDRIQAIRKNALVVNTSPMELFDIGALETRLRVGDMTLILDHPDGLAASDLERFASYESCVIYPSIGYTTLEAAAAKQHIFVENIERFLQGTPINLVV